MSIKSLQGRRVITENSIITNTGEEGLLETKKNAFRLATEDRGRQYQLRRTKLFIHDRSRRSQ